MSKLKPLSAGGLAGLLKVDLKTIHNWVQKGRLSKPDETLGGHMRFDPLVVQADYVRAKRPIPETFAAFLRGEVKPETVRSRAIARASTDDLRAELARREERGAA
jgi:hypothetical protein